MLDPKSDILMALYRRDRDGAEALAAAAVTLTVWEAAALGRPDAVQRALDASRDLLDAHGADGHTPLGLACFFGASAVVRLLLERGADVSVAAANEMRVQPLHAAVAGRDAEVVALLLARGADVNARQQVGYTPLMGAAGAGREDLVDLLLAHGADPSLVAEDGKTAASVARDHHHDALADRLTPANAG
jgi:ankyrin repeat protein